LEGVFIVFVGPFLVDSFGGTSLAWDSLGPKAHRMDTMAYTMDDDDSLWSIVFSIPFDEYIQSYVPLVNKKENMASYNPFENFDDTLFHDFGNEEVLEEDIHGISFQEDLSWPLTKF
jgi:hypothetical protein